MLATTRGSGQSQEIGYSLLYKTNIGKKAQALRWRRKPFINSFIHGWVNLQWYRCLHFRHAEREDKQENSREIYMYKMNPWGRRPSAAANTDPGNNLRFLYPRFLFSLKRGYATNIVLGRVATWMIASNNTVSIYHTSDDCNGKALRERVQQVIWYLKICLPQAQIQFSSCCVHEAFGKPVSDLYTCVCVYMSMCTHTRTYIWMIIWSFGWEMNRLWCCFHSPWSPSCLYLFFPWCLGHLTSAKWRTEKQKQIKHTPEANTQAYIWKERHNTRGYK